MLELKSTKVMSYTGNKVRLLSAYRYTYTGVYIYMLNCLYYTPE